MMIPYGYKQTEVGVIPEDWECVKIKDVATISMCKRIFANQTNTVGDVPFYKIGTFGKEADAYIANKLYVEYRNKFSFPQKGDVLISAAGTLGRTAVYDGEKAYFQDSNIVWLDINKTRLCNEYLNQYYKVIKWASSEGSTIARLYNGIIYATYISLPPLPEQQRIAEALSDVDGMISSLEKLIAKYKSIKTACLQQMFPQNGETVPRMRLPGFTDAWVQRKLVDEVSSVDTGKSKFTSHESGKYEILGSTSVIGYDSSYDYEGDFLLTARVGANAGELYRHSGKVKISDNTVFIQGNQLDFIYYALLKFDIKRLSFGTGQPLVKASELKEQLIAMPLSKTERECIGAFFKQFDNLITLHQRKLEKVQKIKQGMMQQLLTGKIRLV